MTKLSEQRARTTQAWKDTFLETYSQIGNVTAACRRAGVTRQAAYKARGTDSAFAESWDEAREQATDMLFTHAWERATVGRGEPVYYKGEVVGEVKRYSDYLLWKLLCALRPEQFGDRARVEHTGAEGGPIQVESLDYIDRQIEQLNQELAAR